MPLFSRKSTCANCGVLHDRDVDAACVIRHFGIAARPAGGVRVAV
jgi:transposase